jgi:hypothetical protein
LKAPLLIPVVPPGEAELTRPGPRAGLRKRHCLAAATPGHDAQGRAVFKSEDLAPTRMIPSGDAAMLLIWTTATVPADNNDEPAGASRVTLEGGSVIRIVDMLPGRAGWAAPTRSTMASCWKAKWSWNWTMAPRPR